MQAEIKEQNYRLAAAMTIAVFCMGQIPGSIDAAISKISIAFNLSSTSGMYVTTVASLVSVAFSILLGFIAGKKIGFKPLILFCATVELLSAVFPFFTDNFVMLIVLRGLFGIGFGGMQSLENTVASTLIPVERRASMLGLGICFGFGTNCVLQFIGGILAELGWNYVFLNHLLLILPYIVILYGCAKLELSADKACGSTASVKNTEEAASSAVTDKAAEINSHSAAADKAAEINSHSAAADKAAEINTQSFTANETVEINSLSNAVNEASGANSHVTASGKADSRHEHSEQIPVSAYLMWGMMLFVGIFIAPILIGCSFLSEQIIDSATVAGIVAVCFSVGCMAGGLLYARLYKVLGNFALPVFLILLAAGIAGCGMAHTVVLLCILIFVAGFGFSNTQSMAMTILGQVASPRQIAMVSALMMALFNLGMFLSSSFEAAIGAITGDGLYMPLYIGAVVLLVFAAVAAGAELVSNR